MNNVVFAEYQDRIAAAVTAKLQAAGAEENFTVVDGFVVQESVNDGQVSVGIVGAETQTIQYFTVDSLGIEGLSAPAPEVVPEVAPESTPDPIPEETPAQ